MLPVLYRKIFANASDPKLQISSESTNGIRKQAKKKPSDVCRSASFFCADLIAELVHAFGDALAVVLKVEAQANAYFVFENRLDISNRPF